MLDEAGKVYSCGWHELGQLGVSNSQRELDFKEGKTWHEIQLQEGEVLYKAVQISCGAVFSVALTEDGAVFSWGSNNNGQMATHSSMEINANESEELPTQVERPIKIEFDDQIRVEEIIAGDCHVIVKVRMEQDQKPCFYAWGQGQILENGDKDEEFRTFQDVICNQPVQIDDLIQNEMTVLEDDKL